MNILVFLTQTAVSIADPLSLIGYVIAGVISPRWREALGLAGFWAVVMEALVAFVAAREDARYAFGDSLAPRLLGALAAAGVVFWIAHAVRRHSKSRPPSQ